MGQRSCLRHAPALVREGWQHVWPGRCVQAERDPADDHGDGAHDDESVPDGDGRAGQEHRGQRGAALRVQVEQGRRRAGRANEQAHGRSAREREPRRVTPREEETRGVAIGGRKVRRDGLATHVVRILQRKVERELEGEQHGGGGVAADSDTRSVPRAADVEREDVGCADEGDEGKEHERRVHLDGNWSVCQVEGELADGGAGDDEELHDRDAGEHALRTECAGAHRRHRHLRPCPGR
mmetsp:Transcript_32775/g.105894  ORF Transcript_32775/g.105894 Transcript_32775/m.105894 type:complete len:238 (+) Transcript_32775:447-1160(+)